METSIKFKRANLANYDLLDQAGKYSVKVQNNVSEKNLFTDESGSRYIVNLRAIAKENLPQVAQVFGEAEEVDIEQTNGLFLTASIWKKDENDQPALPMKGEEVEVTFGPVADRQGVEVMRITNIHVLPAKKATKLSLASLTEPAAVPGGIAQ